MYLVKKVKKNIISCTQEKIKKENKRIYIYIKDTQKKITFFTKQALFGYIS